MFAHVDQIVGKCGVVFRLEVVGIAIPIARAAAAVGHVVRRGIAESFEYRIRAFFFNLEHDFALCGVAVPVVRVAVVTLKSFHLGTQTFAAAHVMLRAIGVIRVVAAADVVAENVIV